MQLTYQNLAMYKEETNAILYNIILTDGSSYILEEKINLAFTVAADFILVKNATNIESQRLDIEIEINKRQIVKQEKF